MFSLVALLCLYMGGNNIRKAFALAPFDQWAFINWALFITGIAMLAAVIPLIMQAMKDLKERNAQIEEKAKEEKKKRQRQFFYDEETENTDVSETEESDDEETVETVLTQDSEGNI
ncbi:MAG: hypothetical protein IKU54_01600 [Oscillospiraceae bacterium]|nr:hypothetical protein [Oscillospiraceae bacterium]